MLQDYDKEDLRHIPRTPLLPPRPTITSNVRVSSNEKDTDVDVICEKLMKNRNFHKDFDPMLGEADAR